VAEVTLRKYDKACQRVEDATQLTLVDELLLHGEAQKFGVIR
jgi:hypothetical protein